MKRFVVEGSLAAAVSYDANERRTWASKRSMDEDGCITQQD